MWTIFALLLSLAFLASLSPTVQAQVNEALIRSGRPAPRLSDWGLFRDIAKLEPAEGVVPYHLITPLFTDYALKYRFVHVPKGAPARYDPKEAFAFPIGSVLVKTFAYSPDLRRPEVGVRWLETRLLVHSTKGWRAFPYVWKADGSDALLKVGGAVRNVSFIAPDGRRRDIRYHVPNMNQCKGCHVLGHDISPIGPKARNLNALHDYGNGLVENQLVHWARLGILSGGPADPDAAPRVPAFEDPTAPLEARARAYLDVNCAHCHRREGPASTSGLFLTWDQPAGPNLGIMKRPTAAGRGAGDLLYDIVPGRPDESILVYRMESTDPGVMMPELGRSMVHEEGVRLIREWIAALGEDGR
ncbi:MAG: hypothetical protein D6757_09950 [Alphaproteobacteria bacterium]|nr:MAG: hypothetical protein D6757_09950 [Alphaproteobacteria bacterium]